eukprot:3482244-Pyramimonas_sp.AAC.1
MSKWAADVWAVIGPDSTGDFFHDGIVVHREAALGPLLFLEKKVSAGQPQALAQLARGKAA